MQLLDEFKNAAVADERKNAKNLLIQHQQLADSICELIFERYAEQQEEMEKLCQELLTFYYCGGSSKCFCVQFLPILIGTYLLAISQGNRRHCANVETLLLSIYNNEVSKQASVEKSVEEIRLATLVQPSIYHKDPATLLTGTVLIDNSVDRAKSSQPILVKIGPYPSCATLNVENRYLIITRLWKQFNTYLNFVNTSLLIAACKIIVLLCQNGFNRRNSITTAAATTTRSKVQSIDIDPEISLGGVSSETQRIGLHPSLLLELTNTIHFGLYANPSQQAPATGQWAWRALRAVHSRAVNELYAEVLLTTGAMLNAVGVSFQQDRDKSASPVSSSAATTSNSSPGRAKEASKRHKLVTNASLRIKRIAEDISRTPEYIMNEVAKARGAVHIGGGGSTSPLPRLAEKNEKTSPNGTERIRHASAKNPDPNEHLTLLDNSQEPRPRSALSTAEKRSFFLVPSSLKAGGRQENLPSPSLLKESVSAADFASLQKRHHQKEQEANLRKITAAPKMLGAKKHSLDDDDNGDCKESTERRPSFFADSNGTANFIDEEDEQEIGAESFRLKTPTIPKKSGGNGSIDKANTEATHF